MSIEAKDLVNALENDKTNGYCIRNKDGEINCKRFNAVYDYSLDSAQLQDVYARKMRRKDFAFKVGKYWYTKNIICVTFQYTYKDFNQAGKNTYIRNGWVYKDCEFIDGAYVRDGRLIGLQTNIEINNPLPIELLEPYFFFNGSYYETSQPFTTLMDKSELRNYLYENGFMCDGVHYVRYKRSSGASRVGKCLFVNEALAKDMEKWDKCGLKIKDGDPLDLAAYESYISLPMSSIIDTIEIPLESILVVDDCESTFEDTVVAVSIEHNHLKAETKDVTIDNNIFDGESLLDKSLFGKYEDKGMILLRNNFFKSCCFNTNLQQFFSDKGIASVNQLNGFTLANDITQIKMVTTKSSIKYAKFGTVEQWLENISPTFGVVKFEKEPHYFNGKMVQSHYQLLNTLHMSKDEMKELLADSLDYISSVRNDPTVLRYEIKYPQELEYDNEISSLKTKNEIVYKMLSINDKFSKTKLYYDFRDDLVKGAIRKLKQGHILLNGNYSTMMGNGLEYLYHSIGRFTGEPIMRPGTLSSSRFDPGQTILCSRSPHICAGNILLLENEHYDEIDKYFNLTSSIVCVNSINHNIQQQLNGCDFDSDTILLTDNTKLIELARRHYGEFKVPTNLTTASKIQRYYTTTQKADLDIKTSVNKIGEICN